MKLYETLQELVIKHQGSASALLSFREYCTSMKNHILKWMSDEVTAISDRLSVVVPWTHEVDNETITEEVLGYVSKEQFVQASNDLASEFDVLIGDQAETVRLTADELMNAVEESISTTTIQAEFVDYCLTSESVSADSFKTKIATMYQTFSPSVLDSFGNLFNGNSPVEALRGLLSSMSITGLQKKQAQNEYISIVSPYEYTGVNVLLYALNKVTAVVDSFFINVVWEGIKKIGQFLASAWEALKKLAIYIVKLVASPLFSRYDAQTASIGILDLPVVQVLLDKFTITKSNTPGAKTAKCSAQIAPWSAEHQYLFDAWLRYTEVQPDYQNGHFVGKCYHRGYQSYLSETWPVSTSGGLVQHLQNLASMCTEVVDGTIYKKPVSFPLPIASGANSIVSFNVTFGFNEDDELIMQLFPVFPKTIMKSYNDKQIYNLMRGGLLSTLQALCTMTPVANSPLEADANTWCAAVVGGLMEAASESDPDDNFDVVAHLVSYRDMTTWSSGGYNMVQYLAQILWRGIIPYIGLSEIFHDAVPANMSFAPTEENWRAEWRNSLWMHDWMYHANSYYDPLPTIRSADFNGVLDAETFGFLPYVANSSLPVAVHYQAIDEVANEVITYTLAVVIIAIVAWASIKYYKYTKKRRALAAIKRGAADNASWTMGSNPSKEQIKEYLRLDKAARKAERLNRVLGIATSGDSSSSILDSVSRVKNVVLQTAGVDGESLETQDPTRVITTKDIMKIIVGD